MDRFLAFLQQFVSEPGFGFLAFVGNINYGFATIKYNGEFTDYFGQIRPPISV